MDKRYVDFNNSAMVGPGLTDPTRFVSIIKP